MLINQIIPIGGQAVFKIKVGLSNFSKKIMIFDLLEMNVYLYEKQH